MDSWGYIAGMRIIICLGCVAIAALDTRIQLAKSRLARKGEEEDCSCCNSIEFLSVFHRAATA